MEDRQPMKNTVHESNDTTVINKQTCQSDEVNNKCHKFEMEEDYYNC